MFSEKLLSWYDKSKRMLPWRKNSPDPYHIWLSEIMLQQTTVATVIPYFERFLEKWPTVHALARATLDDVLVAWQGLGYYSRARNLHSCAQFLAQDFPSTREGLQALPGIGPYTAGAIASIAFEQKEAAVDGNVVRVLSRFFALKTPSPTEEVRNKLEGLLPSSRCGDFTQALMELGALVCRPKNPLCEDCPLREECIAYALKTPHAFPVKVQKKKLPTRYATAYIIRNEEGAILLRKRPPKGLLGGMMEVPTTPWEEQKGERGGPFVRHTFTHFHLEVDISYEGAEKFTGIWVKPEEFHAVALPTLMKKILKKGLKEGP